MIVTKEQLEAVLRNYEKENEDSVHKCIGFYDGMVATLALLDQINDRKEKEQNPHTN
jgi:protein-tyrosine phosphatase